MGAVQEQLYLLHTEHLERFCKNIVTGRWTVCQRSAMFNHLGNWFFIFAEMTLGLCYSFVFYNRKHLIFVIIHGFSLKGTARQTSTVLTDLLMHLSRRLNSHAVSTLWVYTLSQWIAGCWPYLPIGTQIVPWSIC